MLQLIINSANRQDSGVSKNFQFFKTFNSFEYFQDFEAISYDKKLILVRKSETKFVSPDTYF